MGVYTLDNSEPCTFLFIHEPSWHRPFVVVVVRYNRDIWLDLVLNFETDKPNLEDIQQSYKYGKESTDMPQKNFDRIYKFLMDNVVILVEARRQKQSISDDLPSHIVNIRVINESHPIALPIRTYQYAFGVSFSSAINAGFSVLETYPNSCWETWANDTMNLVLYDGSSSGTICFQHEQGQIRFAVTFGIRQSGQLSLWSDVHFLKPEYKETAEDICNSYSNPYYNSYQKRFRRTIRKQVQGLRNTSLIADDTLVPRAPWRDWKWKVSVHSDVLGKFHNQYKSEIRIFRFKD
ncbi:hypothetical protein BDP27DRAFT_79545 [Rhodocollybia butyracea]|uniref:Uncharacterized protein n=1 Tax=Rhodocollybia butyracea TaxID=206335 RepID=A0A9P5U3L8_9AGAR|nr:hypothetical protein BDP27DRAFT_79545 [Rhodocollybia butyracea]